MEHLRILVKTNSIYYPQECHLPAWNTPVCLTRCLQGESKIEKSLPDRQLGNCSWAAGGAESWRAPSPTTHCCRHGSCQDCFLLEASKPKYSVIVLLEKYNVNLTIKPGTENFQNWLFFCWIDFFWWSIGWLVTVWGQQNQRLSYCFAICSLYQRDHKLIYKNI